MDGTASGLGSKLIPKAIREKRRRKKEGSGVFCEQDHTPLQQNVSNDERSSPGTVDHDDSSPADHDADWETRSARPATISTHPSQIGHLTTSSPLVQAAYNPEAKTADGDNADIADIADNAGNADNLDNTGRSRISPAHSAESGHSRNRTRSRGRSKTGLAPPLTARKSSAGRLRDAFLPKKESRSSVSPGFQRRPLASEGGKSSDHLSTDQEVTTKPDLAKEVSSERRPRSSRGQRLDTSRPQTAPGSNTSAPLIVNTPPTPALGILSDPAIAVKKVRTARSPAGSNASSSRTMISHRRTKTGPVSLNPNKLSSITSAPPTPTPKSDLVSVGNNNSNFFSSMFSAVQNTASTLTNITTTGLGAGNNSKNKSGIPLLRENKEEDKIEVESSTEAQQVQNTESKELAIKTLGMGDLSLSQLGIVEDNNPPAHPGSRVESGRPRARAETAPPIDAHGETAVDEINEVPRPRSLTETSALGEQTPLTASLFDGKPGVGIHRSGSIRSAIGRRKRVGSGTTGAMGVSGMTIGAAIAAATASVAHPHAHIVTPKLTGFAVATKKRNREFHNLFKSVPDDDYLIEDYSCALQREILAHGRLYVSEGHLCFSSNILGWTTTLVMSFDEIVSVEKRSTALVFKNGLEISTLHAKHVFASFASRDSTYDLIVKIWKLGHPSLKSSVNGVRVEGSGGGDKTEKTEVDVGSFEGTQILTGSEDESDEGEGDDEVYDEDEDEGDGVDSPHHMDAQALDVPAEKAVTKKASAAAMASGQGGDNKDGAAAAGPGGDFPGPATHGPTECGDASSHYDRVVGDDVIPAPLGKVYNLLFGSASAAWMAKFLTSDQKCLDLEMEEKRALTDDFKTRTYSYIKPLTGSIGPKQTRCIVTEQLEQFDLENAVSVLCSTQNPDVPSGNIFSVKTRYCLSWAENNATRIFINCTIEWNGKSWLKGPIENGANQGQKEYCKELFACLRSAVTTRPRTNTMPTSAAGRARKKIRKAKSTLTSTTTSHREGVRESTEEASWGVLARIQPFLGPVVETLKPIVTGNVIYGVLVGLLMATWLGLGTPRQPTHGIGYTSYPRRLATYEDMWRHEENELWEWLEEKVSLESLQEERPQPRKKVDLKTVEEKVREAKMDERELKEAIRMTEEHLKVLKSVIEKRDKAESK